MEDSGAELFIDSDTTLNKSIMFSCFHKYLKYYEMLFHATHIHRLNLPQTNIINIIFR